MAISSTRVFSLSIHADYRCRHSGRCCSADWDVPVELPVYRSLTDAMTAGRLAVAAAAPVEPFVVEPDLPDGAAAMLQRTDAGACVFFDTGSHLCAVHRDIGEPALPVTCRHFPRIALRDRRGTSVALSHFCPTAAGMLFREDVPLEIVDSPSAFPFRDYDGLAVGEDDLPPLLRPDMLMDEDGYSAWEAHMVRRCVVDAPPESVLATLVRDASSVRRWKPGGLSLRDAVAALPSGWIQTPVDDDLEPSLRLHRLAFDAVPDDLKPEPDEDGLGDAFRRWVTPAWSGHRAALNRFVAAKAFGSWTAYQGRGIATIVRGLEAAVALVRVEAARQCRDAGRRLDAALLLEAFRAADFILNHMAVGEDLVAGWADAESEA